MGTWHQVTWRRPSPGCHRATRTWSSAVPPPPPHPGQCAAFEITCPRYTEHADIGHSRGSQRFSRVTAGISEASVTNGQGHRGDHHTIRARTAKDNVRHLGLLSLFEYSPWIFVLEVTWSENSPSHWKNKCIFIRDNRLNIISSKNIWHLLHARH